jgi:hypothetical protein
VARVEVNPDWRSLVEPAWVSFAESRLGPDVADDARRFCPVDTGALKASIEDHMEGTDLIVSATGGGEDEEENLFVFHRPGKPASHGMTHPNPGRNVGVLMTRTVHHVVPAGETAHPYATFVELGHRVYHPSTHKVGPNEAKPKPFLRPALFTRRSE